MDKTYMLSAERAREATQRNIEYDLNLELEMINKHILGAIREGEYRTVVERKLRSETIGELMKLGYKCTAGGFENAIIIDWGE